MTHSASNLGKVDIVHRELNKTLGDDLGYGYMIRGYNQFQVIAGDSATIDITDTLDHTNIKCSFRFDQKSFAGKAIYLTASGDSPEPQIFAVELDGTTTELNKGSRRRYY